MAKQGCPNEGEDRRFLGWLICPLQRWLTFKGGPPVTAAIQWPLHFWAQGLTKRGWWFVRLGWRYDWNARLYLLAAAWKTGQPNWTRF